MPAIAEKNNIIKKISGFNRVGENFSKNEKFSTSHTTVRTVRYTAVQST